MKPERLSSLWTSTYKYLALPLWLGFGALGLATLHAGGSDGTLPVLAEIWIAIALFLLWLAAVLVHVGLEGEELVVSSARRTERIPLRDVERVSGTSLLDPELVWIRLRRPTGFGSRIVFIPRRRGFRPFTPHPVVAELTGRITQHQTPGRPPPLGFESSVPGPGLRRIGAAAVLLGVAALVAVAGLRLVAGAASPYHAALEAARASPRLAAELGEPIEADWPADARLAWDGADAATDFVIPLSGPHAAARLHVRAHWHDGEWSFSELIAVFEDGHALDLLDTGPAPVEPPGELL